MKSKTIVILCNLIFFVLFPVFSADAMDGIALLEKMENTFISLAEQLQPTVVSISPLSAEKTPKDSTKKDSEQNKNDNFHGDNEYLGAGSGIILSADGFIITNNHVIGKQEFVEVKIFNGKKFIAKVIGTDSDTDIAVIKIDPEKETLKFAKFGNSDNAKIGQWVVAIGDPFGLEKTVTFGTVTGIGREEVNLSRYENFIQTDASINPGNSGGPLFNIKGEIIGINTAILNYAQGIGFAIPANMAKPVYDQLTSYGTVIRGWLGIGIQAMTTDVAEKFGVEENIGVLINETFKDDPADKAGLLPGDIISAVNGKVVSTPASLSRMIAEIKPEEAASIEVLRDGEKKIFKPVLSTRNSTKSFAIPTSYNKKFIIPGAKLNDITPEYIEQNNISTKGGIIVDSIEKGSNAEQAGLKKNDIIIEVEKKQIDNMKALELIIADAAKDEKLLLRVLRSSRAFYLTVPFSEE